ncbi:hypothetical protein [Thermococcus thioreducens]|uniref:Uncharacterized protein n=1 Tax=Thermococcus thioreducens TaxID=277988 RepID=A0A0Q2M459_9EURY|nr:hypothetical protein [Thermococcus thioreducens]ASJ12043.1 hypothetical protein A3L14_03725 [Thermococcus thioreducens]KQH82738.1 hypothetical protein AMR53_03840 [Thermococcus thioreducens]SEW09490.1 hypothetical protein SAMN05216170_1528 [Thermococcus thioreducens]
MALRIGGVNVLFTGELDDGFEDGFRGLFARRYLPDVDESSGDPEVVIERFKGDRFRVFGAIYDVSGVDRYKLEAGVPSAYGNEAPIFFLLQAAARAGMKKGRIFLTDSVSIVRPEGGAVLFIGYPHSGKSTMSALALAKGLTVLSTENTVIEVRDGKLFVVGGTDVLVYDPKVEIVHHLRIPHDTQTRSGYRITDLSGDSERKRLLRKGVEIEKIIVLHAAFHCSGASFSVVKGRKVRKTLWYFSTGLMKGLDYYEPMPLHVPMTDEIQTNLREFLRVASSAYSERMFEAFGGHGEIFERSFGMLLR